MKPRRPQRVNEFAEACLKSLAASPHGARISIGGAFGLAHYREFRSTNDVDAWWDEHCSEAEREAVIHALKQTLARFGAVSERRHGEVVSVELAQRGKVVFSFQIARRSALLEEGTESPWPPVRLDSLADLVASKTTALVERGAPRDFVDIRELCAASLVSPQDCWDLWLRREKARGVAEPDRATAVEAVLLHLSRIERMRPLDLISDTGERERARALREWFKHEFAK